MFQGYTITLFICDHANTKNVFDDPRNMGYSRCTIGTRKSGARTEIYGAMEAESAGRETGNRDRR